MQNENTALDFLKQLGSVEQMKASAGDALPADIKINTHIHLPPNFSAFETVSQAVELAAEQGVKILGAGNYYDFKVYDDFVAQAKAKGIFPLFGTEIVALEKDLQAKGVKINDPGNPGKYYICGKGIASFENPNDRAKELTASIIGSDEKRTALMADKLTAHFAKFSVDMNLDANAIIDRVVARHKCQKSGVVLQERHLAQAFQEVFFEKVSQEQRVEKLSEIFGCTPKSNADDAVGIQGEIRSYLMKAGKSCFVEEEFANLATAKELIAALGGIACYPTLADGSNPRCEYEQTVDVLIDNLKSNNYAMAEFIPARNTPEVLTEYVKAIRAAGIIIVSGTEHNTLDLIAIEPSCVGNVPVPQEVKDIFAEGTSVLAAHQFLVANGQCGYVDSDGNLNPDFTDGPARIEAFAKLGAAVIKKYFETF